MNWLSFAYMVFAVIISFFAGYYFVVSILLRKQVIELLQKLETTYELNNFLDSLKLSESEESTDSEA